MPEINNNSITLLLATGCALLFCALHTLNTKHKGTGLFLAYLFQWTLFYWIGASIHELPWTQLVDYEVNRIGFQQASYALFSFIVGGVIFAPLFYTSSPTPSPQWKSDTSSLAQLYIIIGLLSYFILIPTLGRISGLIAIVSTGTQLLISGTCLLCWIARHQNNTKILRTLVLATIFLPITTMANAGFLGYGVIATSLVWVFVASFYKPKTVFFAGAIIFAYLGMSFFVAYMKSRDELRRTVWGGEKLSMRLTQVVEIFSRLEPFNITKYDHLEPIDGRINQNKLVGAAVVHLNETQDFQHGLTIRDSLLSIIPRILWPNKPITAGSMGLASKFTGIEFSANTSVGIGPVMESYANFGTNGVIVIFLILGFIIRIIDFATFSYLSNNDIHRFMKYHLLGVAFINVSGSFVEVASGAAAVVVFSYLIQSLSERYQRLRRRVAQRFEQVFSQPTPLP